MQLVQYADDTSFFVADKLLEKATRRLEENIEKLLVYFDHCFVKLNLNADKFEIIETCFNRLKIQPPHDLRISYKVIAVHIF